ncbi:MAG: chromosomal replication initiator protein DnaA [Gemmatimonadetes bacterium]|nr:chromosomal replication initiator protein DnaA [Gemmatimonadota bacterium]MBT6145944.1 chromosomal replication initiator protein DnaA [Gemmatimonadota bacterium]MBT7864557.1 chromosomal replication initiator protein DnaA [Gemmatimonadota bacterium]
MWARCLLHIERQMRPQTFNTWFRPTAALRFDDEVLELEVSSAYFIHFVESNYLPLIQSVVEEETTLRPRITFVVAQEPASLTPPPSPAADRHGSLAASLTPTPVPPSEQVAEKSSGPPEAAQPAAASEHPAKDTVGRDHLAPLNERYVFETFVVGEGNRFAHAAAQNVGHYPGKTQFNPLVIYGGVGLGKTHLLQAIGHHARAQDSDCRVLYVPSEKFMGDFIESLKSQDVPKFQRVYRSADVLLVDDIQFLPRGEHIQNEFFHTFNALHQSGKQIVMTCDSPPGELEKLEERLISRFQWGLVTSIEPPDLETRIAILQQKAESNGILLPEDVSTFLGNYVSSNIRELEGALNHIMAYCAVNQVELSVDAARRIVQERSTSDNSNLSIEGIQRIVARHFNLTPELLIGKTRKQDIVAPRQIAMYLAKRLTKSPLKVIGLHFGNRDHSTVVHAVRSVDKKRGADPVFAQLVESLSEEIQQISGH